MDLSWSLSGQKTKNSISQRSLLGAVLLTLSCITLFYLGSVFLRLFYRDVLSTHLKVGFWYLLTIGGPLLLLSEKKLSPSSAVLYLPAAIFYYHSLSQPWWFELVILALPLGLIKAYVESQNNVLGYFYHNKLHFFQRMGYFLLWQLLSISAIFFSCHQSGSLSLDSLPAYYAFDRSQFLANEEGLEFFYEEKDFAVELLTDLQGLKAFFQKTPFYQNQPLRLILKSSPQRAPSSQYSQEDLRYVGGGYSYLVDSSYIYGCHDTEIYDIHSYDFSDIQKTQWSAVHELSHQMIAHYYGRLRSAFGMPLWKNEGYAEYLAAKFILPSRDSAKIGRLYQDYELSMSILQAPFSQDNQADNPYQNYIAAFLQTYYALEILKVEPRDFFKKDYQLRPAEEIIKYFQK